MVNLSNFISCPIDVAYPWLWLGSVGVACVAANLDRAYRTIVCVWAYIHYISSHVEPQKWVWWI